VCIQGKNPSEGRVKCNVILFLLVVLEMYAKLKDQMKNRRSVLLISLNIHANVVLIWFGMLKVNFLW